MTRSYAAIADQRGATVAGAATALALGAVAIVAQGLSTGPITPLVAAAIGGSVSFGVAAGFGLVSVWPANFHPPGYYPSNFLSDIRGRKAKAVMEAEMIADLEDRLIYNGEELERRAQHVLRAAVALAAGPFIALALAAAAWGIDPHDSAVPTKIAPPAAKAASTH